MGIRACCDLLDSYRCLCRTGVRHPPAMETSEHSDTPASENDDTPAPEEDDIPAPDKAKLTTSGFDMSVGIQGKRCSLPHMTVNIPAGGNTDFKCPYVRFLNTWEGFLRTYIYYR